MLKNIHSSWKKFIIGEINQQYFQELTEKLKVTYQTTECYPAVSEILRVLKLVNFNELKVVILGQDPYHQPGQADGLAFSVPRDTKIPPSLKNIFLELNNDLQIVNSHGDLTKWAQQGVLLLNTVLTVEKNRPLAHINFNWQQFTDNLIKYVDKNLKNVIFILWGKKAQTKISLINEDKHLILKGSHPSPLGAHYGFFNQNYFSSVNEYLIKNHKKAIDWQL